MARPTRRDEIQRTVDVYVRAFVDDGTPVVVLLYGLQPTVDAAVRLAPRLCLQITAKLTQRGKRFVGNVHVVRVFLKILGDDGARVAFTVQQ